MAHSHHSRWVQGVRPLPAAGGHGVRQPGPGGLRGPRRRGRAGERPVARRGAPPRCLPGASTRRSPRRCERHPAEVCLIYASTQAHAALVVESLGLGLHTLCVKPIVGHPGRDAERSGGPRGASRLAAGAGPEQEVERRRDKDAGVAARAGRDRRDAGRGVPLLCAARPADGRAGSTRSRRACSSTRPLRTRSTSSSRPRGFPTT